MLMFLFSNGLSLCEVVCLCSDPAVDNWICLYKQQAEYAELNYTEPSSNQAAKLFIFYDMNCAEKHILAFEF